MLYATPLIKMEHLSDKISDKDLSVYAEKCLLSPSLLGRKLKIEEATLQGILYDYPKDRYEQLYQVLLKWKHREPDATWRDLQLATDSGVKRVLENLYNNGEEEEEGGSGACVQEESVDCNDELCGPPPTKIPHRGDSPVPSAPPYELVHPVQEEIRRSLSHCTSTGSNTSSNGGRCMEDSEADSGPSRNQSNSSSVNNNDSYSTSELTYDQDYCTVLHELGHEIHWHELGLALGLKPSQLDEIKESNYNKVAECRKEMIKIWLKSETTPSWQTLCKALREKIVGNKALAKRIAHKYDVQ